MKNSIPEALQEQREHQQRTRQQQLEIGLRARLGNQLISERLSLAGQGAQTGGQGDM